MAVQKLVNDLDDGTQKIRIGDARAITTPIYSPEISGHEDLKAVLDHLQALEPKNPVLVPGFRWKKYREQAMSGDRDDELKKLLLDYPILMYEPPELFRFSKGGTLVTYALKGSRSAKENFNSHLTNFRVEEALSTLPAFFREFAHCQLSKLYKTAIGNRKEGPDRFSEIAVPAQIQNQELNLSPAEVWQYRIDEADLNDYFISLIKDALSFDRADIRIIPPVPPLRSSEDDVVSDVFDVNETMLYLCERFSSGSPEMDYSQTTNAVYPYLHLYVDAGIFSSDSTVTHTQY